MQQNSGAQIVPSPFQKEIALSLKKMENAFCAMPTVSRLSEIWEYVNETHTHKFSLGVP